MTHAVRLLLVVAAAVLLAAPTVEAQYFGRNKVQYETFEFQVLTTEHFKVYFYPAERDAAEQAARMAERWYARLSTLLKHELRGKQPLILYADHPDFEQTNVVSDQPSEATGGVTESLKRRIILPLGASLPETDHVLGHELVHAFQYDITGQGGGGSRVVPGVTRLPLWFVEGMAEYLSLGPEDAHTAMWMRDAVRRNKLPSLSDLAGREYFPYRYGHAFWAYLGGTYGDDIVGNALRVAGKSGDVRVALRQVTGRGADSLVADWHGALRGAAEPVALATGVRLTAPAAGERPARAPDSAVTAARRLVGGAGDTRLNLAPALSPDGRHLVYLSEASLFSIDVYLADAETGETIRKLFSQTRDPHYESLQFINSAGAWDASGRRFAFGAVARGQPVLTIIDAATGRVEREIPFPELGEIFNPTWAPNGGAIAFSAQVAGFTDLFVYDLELGRLRRLTEDAFADLQPAWSPQGGEIAFVTDRFGTSLATLAYGNYQLAVADAGTGRVRALPALGGGDAKHINPQWSPDGRSLYFLADRGGITNVYRLSLGDGRFTQLTNLYTGVSGITALSPALSVAQRSGRVVFGRYAEDGYELHVMDDRTALAGGPLAAPAVRGAVLPPATRAAGAGMAAALRDPRTGLPSDVADTVAPYRSRFSLDFVAQPSLAIAADRFGTYVGGGATLYWSDMLGDHNLITMAQVTGSFDNFAGLLAYENRKSRWNWGVAAQQVPYLAGAFGAYFTQLNGRQVYVEETEIFRQTNREVVGIVAYPWNRSQRMEFSAGLRHVSFARELERRGIFADGSVAIDEKIALPVGDPLTLGFGSAALVHDNSYFGATSPILGQRWRLEVAPTFGTLGFTTAIADYRRYVMPLRPFTLAGRVLHVGRYGPDADDALLAPLYLGYPSLVRGYDVGSFDPAECPSTAGAGCPVFDQLLGSRLLVGNVELRFPLFGLLGVGDGYYGLLPVEAALFYDAGVAWTGAEGAKLFGDGPRRFVTSTGVSLRMNLFGFAIGQLDYVRPLERPMRDWMVRLSLTPGF